MLNINVKYIKEYIRTPNKDTTRDFWDHDIIEEIRLMASTGKPIRIFRSPRRPYRILDNVNFGINEIRIKNEVGKANISTAFSGIDVTAPIYLADMSFGSLAGMPNIVEAELADELNLISGTGEGGLHPEVAKHRRIFVQWASARFGVDINTLMSGMGIVIKIGQGAKPGIGGHLPGTKVTNVISMVRRIPVGVDALSPAPHHDIYSIEDLKQRIEALREATGKPIYVKIAATNYAPYIATGIARMGADGIIVDGHGAGTGATPLVVRDNIGIPIELAVASIDRMLRDEGVRDRVTLIVSGRISSSDDAVKLMALGADGIALGTALLISMGCAMARTCHRGNCPAGITTKLIDGSLVVEHDFAKRSSMNYLRAFMEEMRLILDYLGIDDVKKIVGKRDLLRAKCLGDWVAKILGVKTEECDSMPKLVADGDLWTPDYSIYTTQLTRTGDVVIVSMGSTGPPEVEPPKRLIDWLRFDGAQVTKPAIDPYREDIDTTTTLARGRLFLSAPIILRPPQWDANKISMIKFAAHATSLMIDLRQIEHVNNKHLSVALMDKPINGIGALVVDYEKIEDALKLDIDTPIYTKVNVSNTDINSIKNLLIEERDLIHGVLIEQVGNEPIEPYIANLDLELKKVNLRHDVDIIVHMPNVRSSGDIIKLAALGADAVEISELMVKALHGKNGKDFLVSSVKFITGLKREIAQLLGAAGIYSFQSVVGNRELLRTMDDRVRELLMVKIAGEEVLYR